MILSNLQRIPLSDGVFFNSVQDSRFKTVMIEVDLILPLSAETASENALLAFTLSRSCKAYPTYRSLCKKLSSLYGAELSTSLSKSGDRQILSITLTGLDDRYALDGESIASQLSELLCQVLFEPNVTDGQFSSAEVEQEKRQLLDLIDSEYNEKRVYAIGQTVRAMCADEVFGVKRYGTAEGVKAQTPQSLYEAWKRVLKTAAAEIVYVGDSRPDGAVSVFRQAFSQLSREPVTVSTEVRLKADKVRRVSEELDVSQAKLVMGFRGGRALPDEKVTASRLMAAVLGGTATSKLFCNVREKQSLCYYCAARYDIHKGIMLIDSGVEAENIEKLEAGIHKEIADMQNGVISDFELEATKMAVINAFRSTRDTVRGIGAWTINRILDGDLCTVEEMAAKINAVTKDEVVEAARLLSLDTVYVLKNK